MGRRSISLATATLAVGLLLGACGDDAESGGGDGPAGPPADATVELEPTTFDPEEVKIAVGETVRWDWAGGVQHNVVFEGFQSELQTKGSYSRAFDTAGTFAYLCEVHPTTMKGTVVVE
ncbi:MAG TPA: plastocyanin/azurin family copper-binding protein [Acidimicrobiales bacterium]|nr:plastocyanin/azurin family copper-binding protein [Acidimicrobiales bacterium]